jgi:hydroxymethylglutaryl-CoA lyase
MRTNPGEEAVVTDVTLREYGQNVPSEQLHVFTPEIRIKTALGLVDAGFQNLEVLSCVHPRVAPAMNKEAMSAVAAGIGRAEAFHLITLVPNLAGYEHFLSLGLGPDGYKHTVGIFFSAVEAHNLRNLGRPIKETLQEYSHVLQDASSRHQRVVAYISAAFGYIDPEKGGVIKPNLEEIASRIDFLFDNGVEVVTLSDLQGVADEKETRVTLEVIVERREGRDTHRLGYHPHHVSSHQALANSKAAFEAGIRRFDSSLGGTGGCVTGAPGNQPTEGLIRLFGDLGVETGVDAEKVSLLSEAVRKELYQKISLKFSL